jgi:hypothetical protein
VPPKRWQMIFTFQPAGTYFHTPREIRKVAFKVVWSSFHFLKHWWSFISI